MTALKVAQHSIFEALKKLDYKPQIQEETSQIYMIFRHERREFPLFVRILHEGELMQLLTFIPCNVKPSQVADLARFLHMVNKELDMPGFCVDEASMTVFYRLMLPALKKEVSQELFEAFLSTSFLICKTFSPVIEAIAAQAMTLEEVLKKAEELKAQTQAGTK